MARHGSRQQRNASAVTTALPTGRDTDTQLARRSTDCAHRRAARCSMRGAWERRPTLAAPQTAAAVRRTRTTERWTRCGWLLLALQTQKLQALLSNFG
jgi:hypothetical protein